MHVSQSGAGTVRLRTSTHPVTVLTRVEAAAHVERPGAAHLAQVVSRACILYGPGASLVIGLAFPDGGKTRRAELKESVVTAVHQVELQRVSARV